MTDSNMRKLVARTGLAAKLPFPVHPHMLRHACGFKLANEGHDTRSLQHYLGHKNIAYTVRYTDLAPDRFKSFWKDKLDIMHCPLGTEPTAHQDALCICICPSDLGLLGDDRVRCLHEWPTSRAGRICSSLPRPA
jgi:Phage integrase family